MGPRSLKKTFLKTYKKISQRAKIQKIKELLAEIKRATIKAGFKPRGSENVGVNYGP